MSDAERIELKAWRLAGGRVLALLERVLAAQGDHADTDILKLQHAVSELVKLGEEKTPRT